jgi:hypothetical protein
MTNPYLPHAVHHNPKEIISLHDYKLLHPITYPNRPAKRHINQLTYPGMFFSLRWIERVKAKHPAELAFHTMNVHAGFS